MRPTLLILVLAALGCHPTITFDTQVQGSTTVSGSPLGGVLGSLPQFGSFNSIDFSQTQEFQNQGVQKQDVDSVKVKSVTLQITSPTTADFSWLDSLTFTASIQNQQDVIASKSNISQMGLKAPTPQFNMDIPDVELKPYVTAPSMSVTSAATGRPPQQDTTLQATLVVTVVANIVH